jgi:hypothetical protein
VFLVSLYFDYYRYYFEVVQLIISEFDVLSLQEGSLDDPSWSQPQVDIYVASAQPWDYLNPDSPKFIIQINSLHIVYLLGGCI